MKLIGKQIKKLYRVYFNQINQCNYAVKAEDTAEAIEKAYRNWKRNNCPSVSEIEEEPT